jgi:aryl sulfotransferase
MTGLVVLASYPKSGNTWMRAFLGSLVRGGRTPDINTELTALTLTWRSECDAWIDLETSDLTAAEVATIRPYVSRRAAATAQGVVKVHDANVVPPGGREPPYPADSIDRVIYIVRDPRDVAVSSVHHYGKSIEAIVADMNDPGFGVGYSAYGLSNNIQQHISTWSRHVESWLDATGLRVHLVRYEDMAKEPERTFADAAVFLGLDHGPEEISRATRAASFQRLADQEAEVGFREISMLADAPFFRRGKAGGWREELPPVLAEQIVRDHGPVMRRIGYLD